LSAMMDSGRRKGAVANSSVFISENIDELTPMPSARVSNEMMVKPGDLSRVPQGHIEVVASERRERKRVTDDR